MMFKITIDEKTELGFLTQMSPRARNQMLIQLATLGLGQVRGQRHFSCVNTPNNILINKMSASLTPNQTTVGHVPDIVDLADELVGV